MDTRRKKIRKYPWRSWNIYTIYAKHSIQLRLLYILFLFVVGTVVIINSYYFPNPNYLLDAIILFNDGESGIPAVTRIITNMTKSSTSNDVHQLFNITSSPTETVNVNTTMSSTSIDVQQPLNVTIGPNVTDGHDDLLLHTIASMSALPKRQMSRQEAIELYRSTVLKTNTSADRCIQQRMRQHSTPPLITPVLNCLRLTHDDIELLYPIDAEQHYNEIRYKMASFAQHQNHRYHKWAKFSGPWIENYFISHFETVYDSQHETTCLHQHFGPYIPIFLPWVDHLANNKKNSYPDGFMKTLLSTLRPNVPYITVSQNARGLKGRRNTSIRKSLPNVLVLSAGGHGHVPIPLLKQDEKQNNFIDVQNRTIDISYVGSLVNAPNGARRIMNEQLLAKYSNNQTHDNKTHHPIQYEYYYGKHWRQYMAQSKLSLVPRGFGRTAYHLVETIHMGLIPVFIYLDNDVPWIPYETLYRKQIGYVTDFASVIPFLENTTQHLTDDEIRKKEQTIVSLRQSHFSIDGILQQIQLFMLTPTNSDLQCQALPWYVMGTSKFGT